MGECGSYNILWSIYQNLKHDFLVGWKIWYYYQLICRRDQCMYSNQYFHTNNIWWQACLTWWTALTTLILTIIRARNTKKHLVSLNCCLWWFPSYPTFFWNGGIVESLRPNGYKMLLKVTFLITYHITSLLSVGQSWQCSDTPWFQFHIMDEVYGCCTVYSIEDCPKQA
jgi:hypothetical protein